jgi:hypothetical protein
LSFEAVVLSKAIAISETWLDSSVINSEIQIEGYSILRNDRDRHGGGVCTYIINSSLFGGHGFICMSPLYNKNIHIKPLVDGFIIVDSAISIVPILVISPNFFC